MGDELATSNVNRSYSLAATSIAIFTFILFVSQTASSGLAAGEGLELGAVGRGDEDARPVARPQRQGTGVQLPEPGPSARLCEADVPLRAPALDVLPHGQDERGRVCQTKAEQAHGWGCSSRRCPKCGLRRASWIAITKA